MNIRWKHQFVGTKKGFQLMSDTLFSGGLRTIEIDKMRATFKDVKEKAVDAMKNVDNEHIFDSSTIQMGTWKGEIFKQFDEEENSLFLPLLAVIRARNNEVTLYLITTAKDERKLSTVESPASLHQKVDKMNVGRKEASQKTETTKITESSTSKVSETPKTLAVLRNKVLTLHTEEEAKSLDKTGSDYYEKWLSVQIIPYSDLQMTEDIIGRGGYGTVYKGKWNGKTIAAKEIAIDDKFLLREIDILSQVRHDNIISLLAVSKEEPHYYYLVMEFFDSQELRAIIMDPEVKRSFMLNFVDKIKIGLQVVRAVYFLHGLDVIHKDLKLENVLANPDLFVKICDFGSSRMNYQAPLISTRGRVVGTEIYFAPELFPPKEEQADKKTDIWALGCLLTEFFLESWTWPEGPYILRTKLTRKFAEKKTPSVDQIECKELQSLLLQSFSYDPSKRPTVYSFVQLFERLTVAE